MPDLQRNVSRAIKRQGCPKNLFRRPLADTSTATTRGCVAELHKLGVDSLAPALADVTRCFVRRVPCHRAWKDGEITRHRKTKGTGENAAEDYRNISILEHCGKVLVGANCNR